MAHLLIDNFEVAAPLSRVWRLLCTPENLPRITPRWMRFRVASPSPVVVGDGAVIDYTMAWKGIPLRWRSMITEYEPHRRLSYIQLIGPYQMWLHQHQFEEIPGGTRVCDRCVYTLHGGPLGRALHHLAVQHQVLDIFRHRRRRIARLLGSVQGLDGPRITSF